jgi:hypothetical protein
MESAKRIPESRPARVRGEAESVGSSNLPVPTNSVFQHFFTAGCRRPAK